ncbi:MAG: FAD-dependent oxidoreductase [Opitutaceae bacterium]|nr:FAD-dependent oxidoreductase [Opitutaceae bacterium]
MTNPVATHGLSRRHFVRTAAWAAGVSAWPAALRGPLAAAAAGVATPVPGKEERADVLVVGASLGGVAAALAAARMGRSVILTEETAWIGGQATTQGIPLDEHPWAEEYGRTRSYAEFRAGVRAYYRRNYPLIPAAQADPTLNPGAGWVSKLCFEPRVGLAVLFELLAPHLAAGRLTILPRHRPVAAVRDGDFVRAVTVEDETSGARRTLTAPYILDGTELGDLLELAGVESMIGAESRTETGEPLALEGPANPREQMVFTHVFALEHRPGEEHVIARPRDYEFWRNARSSRGAGPKFALPDLFGARQDHFGRPIKSGGYVTSTWSFRRILCRDNFAPGAFPSDLTVAIWHANEYHLGPLCGVTTEERRKHLEAARQLSLSVIHWLQTEAPNPATGGRGYPGLRPRGDVFGTADGLAQYPYIRESRRLRAEFTVLEQHFRTDSPGNQHGPVKYADSVGVSGYRIDIHRTAREGGGSITEVAHGKHWLQQIPLGALIPVRVENLLPAGKNLGVTAVTNGAFRVHPTEWNIGEAAGALAAFCLQRNLRPRQVRNTPAHLADFQRELVGRGVELDWPAGRMATARSYYSHHNLELKDADTFYFGEAARLRSPS